MNFYSSRIWEPSGTLSPQDERNLTISHVRLHTDQFSFSIEVNDVQVVKDLD